jgi:hypothetical protein
MKTKINYLHAMFHKRTFAALAMIVMSLTFFVSAAMAAQTPTSATLNGGSSVTVQGGASITAHLIGSLSSGSQWRGTRWRISTSAPGSTSCANTTDYTSNGSGYDSGAFTITAPSSSGTYNAYFIMDSSGSCFGTTGSTYTMAGAVVVDNTAPTFTIQYYSDSGLTTSLGNNPSLKAGSYYVKITSDEALTGTPTISIAAPGTANDVTNGATTLVSGNHYIYTRVISNDAAATGTTLENISITGTDAIGNTATNVNPTNEATKAAYTDTTIPTVTNVTSTASNGTYEAGGSVPVTVTFDEPVTVINTPQLLLATGTPASTAVDYSGGSGSTTLTFNYVVAAGNSSTDLDYVDTSSLVLNGGTVKDAAGNDATLTLAAPGAAHSLGANKALVIDTSKFHAGPKNGSVFANDSSYGSLSWAMPSRVQTSNNSYSTVTLSSSSARSNYLKETGFNFSSIPIPAGSTINGIEVGIERKQECGEWLCSSTVTDDVVKLVKNGVVVGDNKASTTSWPTTDTYAYYGSTSDLWGTTWNASDIKSSDFGVVLSAKRSNGGDRDLSVDHIYITVTYSADTTGPTISGVTSSLADGTYGIGQVVPVQVNFSEPVVVDTGSGIPQLTLSTGTPATTAVDFTSGSGTSTLTFNYTVAEGNTSADLDYADTASLGLNGGTIKDVGGNDAVLTLASPGAGGSLGGTKAMVIDGVAPTITDLSSTAADPTNSSPIPASITFSKAVTGFSDSNITVGNGTVTSFTPDLLTAPVGSVYTFEVTPAGQGLVSVDVGAGAAQDAAGNSNADTSHLERTYDSDNPTVTLSSTTVGPGGYTNVSPALMKATFSEGVIGFEDLDITVTNGTITSFVPDFDADPANSVFNFQVTPDGQGEVTVYIAGGVAQDEAGNNNEPSSILPATYSFTYDTEAPTLDAAEAQDTDGDGKMDRLALTFSEALADADEGSNGFDVSSESNHGLCNGENIDPDGSSSALNLDFTCDNAYTAIGDMTLIFTTSDPNIADLAGNQMAPLVPALGAESKPPITDGADPIVLGSTPDKDSTGQSVKTDVSVTFSEPMNEESFSISDDNGTTYNTPESVWSEDGMTATVSHTNWPFSTTVTVDVDGSDLSARSLAGSRKQWSFEIGPNEHLGQIDVPTDLSITDSGFDLSLGINGESGGNILIENTSQPLNSITSGDLAGVDLTLPVIIGDVPVIPVQAVSLQSSGDVTLTNGSIPEADVLIPNDTTIFGCAGWNGSLVLHRSTNAGNPPSGFSIGDTVFEIGNTSCPLLLDQPVTITLTGLTGPIAYRPAGSSNWFTVTACGGTYASPAAPAAPLPFTECAISDGTNTKIVTYHFTGFGSMTASGSGASTGPGSGYVTGPQSESPTGGDKFAAPEDVTFHAAADTSTSEGTGTILCDRTSTTPVPFTDIGSDPAKSQIENLYRKCAVGSDTDTKFGPNETITRGELAKMLLAGWGLGVDKYVKIFSDLTEDNTFAPYLLRAVKMGLVYPLSINKSKLLLLKPDAKMTRSEAFIMILKAKGFDLRNYSKVPKYADISPNDWFYKMAAFIQNEKLLDEQAVQFDNSGQIGKTFRFPRLLGFTDKGEDVRKLKLVMMQLDYYSGDINSVYDKELSDAMKVFQKANKIQVSGNMGAITKAKLMKEYLNPKTVNNFRPFGAISRSEAAKFMEKAGNLNLATTSVSKANTALSSKVLGVSAVSSASFASFLWAILETAIDNLGKSFGL